MAKCYGKTQSGGTCRSPALKGDRYCFTHSPSTRAAQAAARKLGGQARHTPHFADPASLPQAVTTLEDARRIIEYALTETAGMDNSIARNRLLVALFDSFVKSIEIGEMEARISALEQRVNVR